VGERDLKSLASRRWFCRMRSWVMEKGMKGAGEMEPVVPGLKMMRDIVACYCC